MKVKNLNIFSFSINIIFLENTKWVCILSFCILTYIFLISEALRAVYQPLGHPFFCIIIISFCEFPLEVEPWHACLTSSVFFFWIDSRYQHIGNINIQPLSSFFYLVLLTTFIFYIPSFESVIRKFPNRRCQYWYLFYSLWICLLTKFWGSREHKQQQQQLWTIRARDKIPITWS